MNIQLGPMKAILTATVAAVVLLSACGSEANTALEAAEDAPVLEAPEDVLVVEEAEEVPSPEKPSLTSPQRLATTTPTWHGASSRIDAREATRRHRMIIETLLLSGLPSIPGPRRRTSLLSSTATELL